MIFKLEDDEFERYPGITYENGREHLQQRLDSEAVYGNSSFYINGSFVSLLQQDLIMLL